MNCQKRKKDFFVDNNVDNVLLARVSKFGLQANIGRLSESYRSQEIENKREENNENEERCARRQISVHE